MKLKFHTLDVFTNRKFCGNPLAVVMGADDLSTDQMQIITKEFNLSETAFVMKPASTTNTAKVRIFFPGGEMPFAGHPTLGTAILLADMDHEVASDYKCQIRLELPAGMTPVNVVRQGGHRHGVLTAPIVPSIVDVNPPHVDDIAKALGLSASDVGFDSHAVCVIAGGPRFSLCARGLS